MTSIALVPFYPKMGQTTENLKKIVESCQQLVEEKKVGGILFPELAVSGYMLEDLTNLSYITLQEKLLNEIAQLSKKCEITFGAVLKENHELYNAALTYHRGELVQVQKKIYLPTYGMFDEARFFQAGDCLQNFDGVLGKSAVLICEDAWHNVLPYILAVERVRVVYVLSNSPLRQSLPDGGQKNSSSEFWQKMLSVYAVCNNQILIYINRSGVEDGVTFGGESFIALPNGQIIEKEVPAEEIDNACIFELDNEVLDHAFDAGGSFFNENHLLNQFLLQKAIQHRMN